MVKGFSATLWSGGQQIPGRVAVDAGFFAQRAGGRGRQSVESKKNRQYLPEGRAQ
jgi:hypothetical protein